MPKSMCRGTCVCSKCWMPCTSTSTIVRLPARFYRKCTIFLLWEWVPLKFYIFFKERPSNICSFLNYYLFNSRLPRRFRLSSDTSLHQSRMYRHMPTDLLWNKCRMSRRLQSSCPLLLSTWLSRKSTRILRKTRMHHQPRLSIQFGLHQWEMSRSMQLCWRSPMPCWQSCSPMQMPTGICRRCLHQVHIE